MSMKKKKNLLLRHTADIHLSDSSRREVMGTGHRQIQGNPFSVPWSTKVLDSWRAIRCWLVPRLVGRARLVPMYSTVWASG